MNIQLSRYGIFSALIACLGGLMPVYAQPKSAEAMMAEIALSQDRQRAQVLIEGAKKEGALTIYYSARDLAPAIEAFSKKYGIKVKSWKSNGEAVVQRTVNESRGGRIEVDLVGNEEVGLEALRREKLLQRAWSPHHADLVPQAVPAHREWAGTSIDVFVQAYNTDKVKKQDLPRTYQDLSDPKWKSQLGIESDDHPWFATLIQAMGPETGIKQFKNIVDINGMSVRKGHNLLTQLVASGEVPVGLTMYNYLVDQAKNKGAPIDSFILSPAIASFKGIAVLKRALHPHAAMLFYDFMLADGQKIMADRFLVPTSSKLDSPLRRLPLQYIDPVQTVDRHDKWIKDYEDTVTKRVRPN